MFIFHHDSDLCWESTKEENHSPRLRRGYTTSILELGVGFRALANFRFSVEVKFQFSQRNWPSATAFKYLKDKGWEFAASADWKVQSG